MNYRILIFAILIFNTSYSQFHVKGGFSLNLLPFTGTTPLDTNSIDGGVSNKPFFVSEKKEYLIYALGLQLYGEYLIPLKTDLAFGLSGGVSLNAWSSKNDFLNGILTYDFPAHVIIRYGYMSSKKSKKDVGFGLGIGYHYHIHFIPYGTLNIIGEVVYDEYFIRFNFDPFALKLYTFYSSEGLVQTGSLRQFGVTVGKNLYK
jgi:hypothetical protein